jgi:hypothetical protein
VWQEIVKLKYVKGSHICHIQNKITDSPIWSDLLKARNIYLEGREYKLHNVKLLSFWADTCRGGGGVHCVLNIQSYMTCVLTRKPLYMRWLWLDALCSSKIRLPPVIRDQWYILAQKLNEVVLNEEQDKVIWKWSATRKFTIKSLYSHVTRNDNGPAYSNIRKSKLPEKIQIFM